MKKNASSKLNFLRYFVNGENFLTPVKLFRSIWKIFKFTNMKWIFASLNTLWPENVKFNFDVIESVGSPYRTKMPKFSKLIINIRQTCHIWVQWISSQLVEITILGYPFSRRWKITAGYFSMQFFIEIIRFEAPIMYWPAATVTFRNNRKHQIYNGAKGLKASLIRFSKLTSSRSGYNTKPYNNGALKQRMTR